MKKKTAPDREYARLPNCEKVVVLLREGNRVLVRRIRPNDPRQGTLAVCESGKLRRAKLQG